MRSKLLYQNSFALLIVAVLAILFGASEALAQTTSFTYQGRLTDAFCNSSSLRYKTNVTNFAGGMNIINRLRPISFTWKQDGVKDIGFGAEEVERVAPLFTFRNDKGEIEGVRYDRLGVVFVNAFKEQQSQIQKQQEQLARAQTLATEQQEQIKRAQAIAQRQQQQLNALQKLVCRSHRRALVCR